MMAAMRITFGHQSVSINSIEISALKHGNKIGKKSFSVSGWRSKKVIVSQSLKLQASEDGLLHDDDRTGRRLARRQSALVNNTANTGTRWHVEPDLNLAQRLVKAWSMFWEVLLPPRQMQLTSADCARERLRLLLFYERGELPKELEWKIRETIVDAISDYVDIINEESVALNVTADAESGTVFSITVPVRRVKPEFQETGYKDRISQVFGEEDERADKLYQALGKERMSVIEWRDEVTRVREDEAENKEESREDNTL